MLIILAVIIAFIAGFVAGIGTLLFYKPAQETFLTILRDR